LKASLEYRWDGSTKGQSFKEEEPLVRVMSITAEEILAEIGPVQEILDEHDGVVNVIDTSDGNIMLSLDGGCNGCSSTPMTAMQIYYSLKKLDHVNDVIFVNGELPEYMRTFIDQKMAKEAAESGGAAGGANGDETSDGTGEPQGEIV
jgi:Fe-S cluster biogenesis protein NfuA